MNVRLLSLSQVRKQVLDSHLEAIGEEPLEEYTPEQLIIYVARVSSSRKNKLEDYSGLLRYLIDNEHWSPFQHAFMTLEIQTSRAIGRQYLRHLSFTFQELSQRYAKTTEFEEVEVRRQAETNRQSSSEVFDPEVEFLGQKMPASEAIKEHQGISADLYSALTDAEVATESARFVLPGATSTTLHMTGSVRSWVHLIQLRQEENTQKEARLIADEAREIFCREFPVVSKAVGFTS